MKINVKIKVLIIGNGGRETAMIWKLMRSKRIDKIFATGNGGMYAGAEKIEIPQTDFAALAKFAKENRVGLTIVAMDDLLATGIVDYFQDQGLRIFGPTKAAAQIEWSKKYAKDTMKRAGIPTAGCEIFYDHEAALEYAINVIHSQGVVVIKADGLALGKGVKICRIKEEAKKALDEIMIERAYGDSGSVVLIEEFLEGPEFSLHVVCDTKGHYQVFPITQDHKREGDGDTGRNTGGMGVVGPIKIITDDQLGLIEETVIKPLLAALASEDAPFVGCLYPGMILTPDGPKVLEVNARFGDPEMQVYMMLLKSDLLDILEACIDGTLDETEIEWETGFATCIAMASEGYPGEITKKGMVISGVNEAEEIPGVRIFYAGAKADSTTGEFVNSGGRVLYVVALEPSLAASIFTAYRAITKIYFEGHWYRTDIGAKLVEKNERE
ncbi:MAG: Phosphoribosylamine-glycine ligase [Microgenomates group bacterium GW2011_GWA2_46_7]|nr:MAG: Phosphoribosylamine-glycine ligase [Microgenomates group bacterium GW2011_GWA2_46_7]